LGYSIRISTASEMAWAVLTRKVCQSGSVASQETDKGFLKKSSLT
jgi:hypothetical protein